jgi:hypothetical protein
MSTSIIMALDLGTTTGWATCDFIGQHNFQNAGFKTGRFEGGGMPFLRFKRWLIDFKATLGVIDAICLKK